MAALTSRHHVNPYIAGSAVKGTEMFFGRDDVFAFIRRNLIGQHSNHPLVLYGQRRTGKTSVLHQLHRHLDSGYWCVLIDLHGLNPDGLGNLMLGIAGMISRELRRDHQVAVEVPERSAFLADPAAAFEGVFLDQVWAALGVNQLVLMLDEAVRLDEEMRAGRLDRGAFEYLRHLMQHHERLNFIFSLGSGIEEMSRDCAFLFSGSLYHRISFLEPPAARDLITRPARGHYELSEQAVDRILQVTSRHPYYTQLVCHCVFDAWAGNPTAIIDLGDVDDVLAEAIELGSANLTYVWRDSTPAEQVLMAGIAAAMQVGSAAVTASQVREAWHKVGVDVPGDEIARAVRGLIARDVITGGNAYSFSVDLQRLWLDKHRRLDWVKDDLADAIARWKSPAQLPTVRRARARPASLADVAVLGAVAEFKPLMDERTQGKFREFETTLTESSPPQDLDALSFFCGGFAKAIARDLTAPDRQLRLWQITWWALRRELKGGDHRRIGNRLNQLAGVLDSFPTHMRESLVAAHYMDFSALVRSNAKQQFLEWFAGALENAQDADLRQLGGQCMIRLGEFGLLAGQSPDPDEVESLSIFSGLADAAEFERYYQEGRLGPIAELLQRNHDRLLAVTEKVLSTAAHTEYLPPSGRAYIPGPSKKNMFSELKKKALSGSSAQVWEAHNAFNRALPREKREEARRQLAEWKAFTLQKARSVLDAERIWAEAADDGSASKEVLWNLAVYRNKDGAPWRGLRYLAPGVASKSLPLSHVRFGCALAVATLLLTDELDESDPGYEENRLARRFILDHGQVLPVASMHLLRFWLAYFDQQQALSDEASRALVIYAALRDRPYDLPTAAQVKKKSSGERLQAVDQVSHGLQGIGDPCFRLTWRLWIAELAELNGMWWPAWDRWATACNDDHDPAAAVQVLRRAAQLAVKDLRGSRLKNGRESRVNFLRNAVTRLQRFAQDLFRPSLLDEIRDWYVRPVPELMDAKNNKNAHLLASFGLVQSSARQEMEAGLPINLDVWPSLQEDLSQVEDLGALDETLARRIEAAATVDPGTTGRAGRLVESMLGLLRDIVALRCGIAEDQVSEILLQLSGRNTQALEDVSAERLTQLLAPLQSFERVLKHTADSRDAAPKPRIRLADGWAGWPTDHGASSVPVEISFPGPGGATAVRITGGWDGPDYRPAAEVRGARDLSAGETGAYALPLAAPADGAWRARIDVTYDWGPLTRLSATAMIDVPCCTFSEYLGGHGVSAYEFPNPFVYNEPLDMDQVQSALFQGRDQEVAEVRASYGQSRFPPLPLCFYGMGKTGKTSLLHRVALEVGRAGLVGLEVNLYGLRANTWTADQLFLGVLTQIKESAIAMGADAEALPVPLTHPNPVLLVPDFFRRLSDCFGGRRPVVLLDEYQHLLLGPNGQPVLDSLRPVHEGGQVGLIAFSNQGLDPMNMTFSQLGLRSIRVGFLREAEARRLVEDPLTPLGVYIHPSAHREIFALAAGHPNFSAWLAKGALDRLNLDHRNIVTVTDVATAASDILNQPSAFNASWFSTQNLTPAEEQMAIRLAKEDHSYSGLEIGQALSRLGLTTEVARDLEAKSVVEFNAPNLRIRGRLPWAYLRGQVSADEVPAAPPGSTDSVGLFVDLENLRPHKPEGMDYYEFGKKLISYAATLGDLKACYVVIASWNTGEDRTRVKADLLKAGFIVAQEPATFSPGRTAEKRNAADLVLASTVTDELAGQGLSRVVIASGDGDMLPLVNQLLEKRRVTVRMISSDDVSRPGAYLDLAAQRRAVAVARGLQPHEADFDVLLLSNILSSNDA
jgi:hypothetical protein